MLLDLIAYLGLILVLCLLLVRSADLVEEALVHVARRAHVNPFVVGFIVLSVASSLPEISLSISSSALQTPQLAMGDLLGGVIVLLTLAIAVEVLRNGPIPFKGRFGLFEVLLCLIVIALPGLALTDGNVSLAEGLLLLACYLAVASYISFRGSFHQDLHEHAVIEAGKMWRLLVRAGAGIIGLLLVSHLLVGTAVRTAEMLNISSALVGLLVLALGTNLPEIAVSLESHRKGRAAQNLAIGNIIGSATINTAIFGMLAILAPFRVDNISALVPMLAVLATALVIFAVAAANDRKISRGESIILLGTYLALIAVEAIILSLKV